MAVIAARYFSEEIFFFKLILCTDRIILYKDNTLMICSVKISGPHSLVWDRIDSSVRSGMIMPSDRVAQPIFLQNLSRALTSFSMVPSLGNSLNRPNEAIIFCSCFFLIVFHSLLTT